MHKWCVCLVYVFEWLPDLEISYVLQILKRIILERWMLSYLPLIPPNLIFLSSFVVAFISLQNWVHSRHKVLKNHTFLWTRTLALMMAIIAILNLSNKWKWYLMIFILFAKFTYLVTYKLHVEQVSSWQECQQSWSFRTFQRGCLFLQYFIWCREKKAIW